VTRRDRRANPSQDDLGRVSPSYAKDDSALFSNRVVSDLHHILTPNMAWACGGNIVTQGGHIEFLNCWHLVTCPDCLAEGRESISERTQRQQGRGDYAQEGESK